MTGGTAHSLLFLPDHDLLVVGESGGNVRVLDETTRGPTSVICAHRGKSVIGLISLKAKNKHNVFASLGADGEVKLWTPNPTKPRHFEPLDTEVKRASIKSEVSPTGCTSCILSVCGGEKLLYANGIFIAIFDVHEQQEGLLALACSAQIDTLPGGFDHIVTDDGAVFTIASVDGSLRSWSIRGGPPLFSAPRPDASPSGAARATCLRARAGTLAIGRSDGGVEIRAAADGAAMAVIPRRHLGVVSHLVRAPPAPPGDRRPSARGGRRAGEGPVAMGPPDRRCTDSESGALFAARSSPRAVASTTGLVTIGATAGARARARRSSGSAGSL